MTDYSYTISIKKVNPLDVEIPNSVRLIYEEEPSKLEKLVRGAKFTVRKTLASLLFAGTVLGSFGSLPVSAGTGGVAYRVGEHPVELQLIREGRLNPNAKRVNTHGYNSTRDNNGDGVFPKIEILQDENGRRIIDLKPGYVGANQRVLVDFYYFNRERNLFVPMRMELGAGLNFTDINRPISYIVFYDNNGKIGDAMQTNCTTKPMLYSTRTNTPSIPVQVNPRPAPSTPAPQPRDGRDGLEGTANTKGCTPTLTTLEEGEAFIYTDCSGSYFVTKNKKRHKWVDQALSATFTLLSGVSYQNNSVNINGARVRTGSRRSRDNTGWSHVYQLPNGQHGFNNGSYSSSSRGNYVATSSTNLTMKGKRIMFNGRDMTPLFWLLQQQKDSKEEWTITPLSTLQSGAYRSTTPLSPGWATPSNNGGVRDSYFRQFTGR